MDHGAGAVTGLHPAAGQRSPTATAPPGSRRLTRPDRRRLESARDFSDRPVPECRAQRNLPTASAFLISERSVTDRPARRSGAARDGLLRVRVQLGPAPGSRTLAAVLGSRRVRRFRSAPEATDTGGTIPGVHFDDRFRWTRVYNRLESRPHPAHSPARFRHLIAGRDPWPSVSRPRGAAASPRGQEAELFDPGLVQAGVRAMVCSFHRPGQIRAVSGHRCFPRSTGRSTAQRRRVGWAGGAPASGWRSPPIQATPRSQVHSGVSAGHGVRPHSGGSGNADRVRCPGGSYQACGGHAPRQVSWRRTPRWRARTAWPGRWRS